MPVEFVLDTNAYASFFQFPRTKAYAALELKLRSDDKIKFALPEIVSMEIHSVIGKYRRGTSGDKVTCGRQILESQTLRSCSNICVYPKKSRMKAKVYKALLKLVNDIEEQNGDICAKLLPLGKTEMDFGKKFLQKYAHQLSFGSHDALIAGTVAAGLAEGKNLILVTSDKSLKALCREQGIVVFDPLIE